VGSTDLASAGLREIGRPPADPAAAPSSLAHLAARIEARDACSACYGGLLHALRRLQERDCLRLLRGTIRVGQGFRGQNVSGIGVGSCASGCSASLPGCPPAARDILEFLAERTHA
jgi:hypothetical protein